MKLPEIIIKMERVNGVQRPIEISINGFVVPMAKGFTLESAIETRTTINIEMFGNVIIEDQEDRADEL